MTKTIYYVEGYTGEYDTYSRWIVKAFTNKSMAQAYAKLCQDTAEKLVKEGKDGSDIENEFDNEAEYYGYIQYIVRHLELVEEQ